MQIYDISLSLSAETPVWPGHPPVHLERIQRIESGASSNVSRLCLDVHAGTHVDAAVHFLPGADGAESLPLDVLIGPARLIGLPRTQRVTAAELAAARLPARTRRLLIRTRNSRLWSRRPSQFDTNYTGLDASAAEWLVRRGVRLVGVDYLSVAPWKESRATHEVLLRAGVVILEGLNLSRVPAGPYELICLPLKLVGSDGAPARTVLIRRRPARRRSE